MMFYRVLMCLFLVTGIVPVGAQAVLEGLLLEEPGRTPIPYANIGILHSPIGTISNADGSFYLEIPEKYLADTLLFAALGYERKSFSVRSLQDNKKLVITLSEESTVLKNITVESKRLKPVSTVTLGNRYHNMGSIYIDSLAGGSAMALLIGEKPPANVQLPYHVTSAKLRIEYNTFDRFNIRIRFMTVDPHTGQPAHDMVHESILLSSGMRKGWLTFDLQKYNIRIPVARFFVVFEWLIEEEDRVMLMEQYKEFRKQFPRSVITDTQVIDGQTITSNRYEGFRAGTSFGSSSSAFARENFRTYYRHNSYGNWKRSSFVLAAEVTVGNYLYTK